MISWEELLYATAEAFGGQMPHPDTATDIHDAYLRAPKTVLRAIDRITAEYIDGTARSPWGLLRHRVKDIQTDTHNAERPIDRDKAIQRAEQRTRNELLHYDRLDEVMDELFGERGTLRDHDTPALRERITKLWTELRPLGELVEHEAIERGQRNQQHRARLAAKPKPAEPDAGNLEIRDGVQVEA